MLSKFATPAVLALGLISQGGVTEARWNPSEVPEGQVFYYSQWAVYGRKSPPNNKNESFGGTYEGRWFYLDDFYAKASNFYAPGAEKIINFSFAGVDMDSCKVLTVDFWADLMLGAGTVLGPKCGEKGAGYTNGVWDNAANAMVGGSDALETGLACSLRGLKQKDPSWTIALSIGGWTMSSEFSRCARDTTKRRALVDSLQYFIDMYVLDIVDIDWEYPSSAGCGGGADDMCKAVISRKRNYTPNMKPDTDACDPGAIYQLYDTLNSGSFPTVIEHINKYDSIGQAVSTAENCSQFHAPNWGNIPSGASGMSEYWAGTITDKDWQHYIALLTDFKDKTYSNGKKMRVTTAVGMNSCLSKGKLNGADCEASPGFRMKPSYPKGQGVSLKQFCDIQSTSGGNVNFMSYDLFGAWGAPYHNAPLYDNPNLREYPDYLYEFNVDLAARNWLTKSHGGVQEENDGCSPDQINIGIPLYGRSYSKAGKFGKFEPKAASQKLGVGTYQSGVLSLWDIRNRFLNSQQGGVCNPSSEWGDEHCGKWELKRDVFAGCVPWLEKSNGDGTFEIISFDDEYSIGLKAKWARCMGFNGLLYWDAADDQDGVGSKASWEGWKNTKESDCATFLQMSTSCPGAPGTPVCFGNANDACDGTAPEVPPVEPEPSEPEVIPPTPPTEGSCPEYQSCVEGCLDYLS